ncbi:urease accessory protein UreF [Bacillus alkalicellulosilyticus]|uniref:urease accessory protein UreF n=1 Tax=Alkalihalobacterium alkalicellulosilyticum TaxID=1912214 RepID=UPI000996AE41|nr:urease accessory protein UreF [Bacillus alkalicellulosilyticus]
MKKQKPDLKLHLNTRDTTTTNFKKLHLLQIHDSAFPIGAYTHSFGMETYIQKGIVRDKATLAEYCQTYLFSSLVSGDALFVKQAYLYAKEKDLKALLELNQLCHGMKIAYESREGSLKMGRQFLQTVLPLVDSPFFTEWKESCKQSHYAIIYGMYCAEMELDEDLYISAFLYSSTASLVHNAVRAIPLGQNQGVQTIFELLPSIEEATSLVNSKTIDDVANNSIGIELASMEHEALYSRLFIS